MIDKIICLGLDKRKNFWPSLQEQVKKFFNKELDIFIAGDGDDNSLRYDHIDTNNIEANLDFRYTINKGHYNAYLCHKKIFQQAYEQKVKNLLFLEDDIYFVENRMHLLDDGRIKKIIERGNWHVIYLGWWMKRTGYHSEDREDLEEIWSKYKLCNIEEVPRPPFLQHECCGLHGILINGDFLSVLKDAHFGPMDNYISTFFNNPLFIAMFIWPKLIQQKSCWSFCENMMSNRNLI